jgi:hypothetical protein
MRPASLREEGAHVDGQPGDFQEVTGGRSPVGRPASSRNARLTSIRVIRLRQA